MSISEHIVVKGSHRDPQLEDELRRSYWESQPFDCEEDCEAAVESARQNDVDQYDNEGQGDDEGQYDDDEDEWEETDPIPREMTALERLPSLAGLLQCSGILHRR